jgi:hypothetical protein
MLYSEFILVLFLMFVLTSNSGQNFVKWFVCQIGCAKDYGCLVSACVFQTFS